jgi:hypothetical protein
MDRRSRIDILEDNKCFILIDIVSLFLTPDNLTKPALLIH